MAEAAAAEAPPAAQAEAPKPTPECRPLTILSWNVAALKALAKETPPPLTWMRDKLAELGSPEIVCLQEHKLARDALTMDVAVVEGYHAFFAHARTSVGYSGVVTYVKTGVRVRAAAAGVGCCAYRGPESNGGGGGDGGSSGDCACPFECARFRALWEVAVLSPKEGDAGEPEDPRALLQALDAEGRAVMTEHGAFVLVGVYCPFNNPEEPSREAFKHNWNVAVRLRCEALRAAGRAVVLCGDLNAIPERIDQPDVVVTESDMRRSPWVRWMRTLLNPPPAPGGSPLFVDTFRRMHPTREGAYSCWNNQTGARATNYGRRIDFILASPTLCDGPLATLVAAEVQQQVLGSDHCPVAATICFPSSASEPTPFLAPGDAADKLPPLCAATFPEFKGKQALLKGFLQPKATRAAAAAAPMAVAVAAAFAPSKVGAAAGGKGKKKRASAAASAAAAQGHKKPKQQQQLALSRFLVRSTASTTTTTTTSTTGSASASSSVRTVVEEEAAAAAEVEVEVLCIDDDDDEEEEGGAQVDEAAAQEKQAAVRESFLAAFKPQTPPKCEGHDRPMVRRQVKKPGPTFGRYFWSCDLPEGRKGDPGVRCDTFVWDSRVKGVKGGGGGGGKGT